MGWISPNSSGGRASPKSIANTHPADGLCNNGALASLAGTNYHSMGDNPLFEKAALPSRVRHLSKLLESLDDDPDSLATRLLHRFGSIRAITFATEAELRTASAPGERWVEAFLATRRLMNDGLREDLLRSKINSQCSHLRKYLISSIGNSNEENLLIIFGSIDLSIICEETIAMGNVSDLQISPRKIFARALNLNAYHLVLAHNHPSGSARPSKQDIAATKELIAQARPLQISIHDHIVVSHRHAFSMRDANII